MSGLNRREALVLGSAAAAYGIAVTSPAVAAIADAGDEWAKIAVMQFMRLGVDLIKNEDDLPEGIRLGHPINNRMMLSQRHVDWCDPIVEGTPRRADMRVIEPALGALTANIARSIKGNRLKTFSLMMPGAGVYNGVRLSYGHLRMRFLQTYQVFVDDYGVATTDGILNRIDILFHTQRA